MVCGYKEGPIPQDVLPSLHMYISHITCFEHVLFCFFRRVNECLIIFT
jgi:hypothetical protein